MSPHLSSVTMLFVGWASGDADEAWVDAALPLQPGNGANGEPAATGEGGAGLPIRQRGIAPHAGSGTAAGGPGWVWGGGGGRRDPGGYESGAVARVGGWGGCRWGLWISPPRAAPPPAG